MTENEYREIDEAIDKAQESVVPFPVQTEDELSVVGDANRTELNKHDFKISFRVPQDGAYITKSVNFNDVYITPRHNPSIVKTMNVLMPFFRKPRRDGQVIAYSQAEKVKIARELSESQEAFDAMYDLVAYTLGIDLELKDYMTPDCVLESAVKIITQYPEMVNEADTFFG